MAPDTRGVRVFGSVLWIPLLDVHFSSTDLRNNVVVMNDSGRSQEIPELNTSSLSLAGKASI